MARVGKVEHTVHDRDGRIAAKNSYGAIRIRQRTESRPTIGRNLVLFRQTRHFHAVRRTSAFGTHRAMPDNPSPGRSHEQPRIGEADV